MSHAGYWAGVVVGVLATCLVAWIIFRLAQKNRSHDERHLEISMRARSMSWAITMLAIAGMSIAGMYGVVENVSTAMTFLVFVQFAGYGACYFYWNRKM